MENFIPALASGAVSAALAAFGVYVAITNRLTRLEAQREADKELLLSEIRQLRKDVEKHNNLVERMALAEGSQKAAWRQIDEIKEELKDVKIGGTA